MRMRCARARAAWPRAGRGHMHAARRRSTMMPLAILLAIMLLPETRPAHATPITCQPL
eukprot:SAG11_NODE_27759_length_329_cov_0.895652_1_plen_57_part_01